MQIHQLKPINKNRQQKRIGRGGKKGFTSGSGSKGQKSRAGRKFQPIIRQVIKRYPKLRGYRFKFEKNFVTLNVRDVEKKAQDGQVVSPKFLLKAGLISKIKGTLPKVKILGTGELTKPVIVENCSVSKSAKLKIEKAGGRII